MIVLFLHEGHSTAREFFTPENAASYDLVASYATFGQDIAWKRRIVQRVESCRSILELACGTGRLSLMLSHPDRSIIGFDLTFEYLVASKKRGDFSVAQGTAELLPYREMQFDAVVSSYLAKYVDIASVAQECLRILRSGGLVVFHDFTYPSNPGMQILWKAYFRILQFAGLFVPTWKVVFDNLANYVRDSKWEDITASALKKAGFHNITVEYHTAGTAAIVSAEKA